MSLQHAHFRVLIALLASYAGNNNGALVLMREQARKFGIASNQTLALGLEELIKRRLIVQPFQERFSRRRQPVMPSPGSRSTRPILPTCLAGRRGCYCRWPRTAR